MRIELDHRKIVFRIHADDISPVVRTIRQGDAQFIGVLDHMIVGEHVPLPVYDRTGARTLSRNRLEEPVVLEGDRGDVYHSVVELFVDLYVVGFVAGNCSAKLNRLSGVRRRFNRRFQRILDL